MFTRIKTVHFTTLALSIITLITACSSIPKTFGIRGEGDPVLNRDINGKSLSVVVSVYQLKDAREFSKLTFDSLASGRPESELLGPALLEKSDTVVVPGGIYTGSEKLLENAKYVGIVAFFRRPDPYYWRQLVDADTVRNEGLNFRVQDCYVVINGTKAIALPGQPLNGRPECGTSNAPSMRQASRSSAQQAPAPVDQVSKRGGTTQQLPTINIGTPTPATSNNSGFNAANSSRPAAANTSTFQPFWR